MTVALLEALPLFVESWEARMRQACRELNRARDAAAAKDITAVTLKDVRACQEAEYAVMALGREVGE